MSDLSIPFRVRWRLDRPMVITDAPLALDGLLAWARVEEEKVRRPQASEADLTRASLDLPLQRHGEADDWVWRASWLVCTPALEATPVFSIRKTNLRALASDRIDANGHGVFAPPRKLNKVQLGSGALKLYALRDTVQWMERVEAWGVGDPDRCRELLARITALGPKRRNGYGHVRQVTVEPWAEATDLWRWRPLPASAIVSGDHRYAPSIGPLRPPYWDRAGERAIMAPVALDPAS